MDRQDEYYEEEAVGQESEYEEEVEGESDVLEEESGDSPQADYSYERADDEEEEYEEEPKRKGRVSGNARIQQIQREKYQALSELQRTQQENEYWKQMAMDSSSKAQELGDAAMIHYDKNSNLRLEQAKAKKFKAHEEGDIQAEIDADVEIASATHAIQQLSYWKTQQERNLRQQYQQEQGQQQHSQELVNQEPDPQISNDWLARNPWFNPASRDFDSELAQAAREYSEKVENFLYRNGRKDLIMSGDYYEEIDKYIHQLKSQRGQGMKRELNMRPVRGGGAPVRSGSYQSSRGKQTQVLSKEEREISRLMGIKEKDYLSNKLQDMSERPERWNNGGKGNARR